jgi:hypothetical protein
MRYSGLSLLLLCSSASAQVPATEWTPDAKVWLARALVAEAGWSAEDDHAAIMWVLVRRWRILQEPYPGIRFTAVVRAYCSALSPRLGRPSPRQAWVRALEWGKPPGEGLRRFSEAWRDVQQLVMDWQEGWVPDPCPGAVHWGGSMDVPWLGLVRVSCGSPTANHFYRLVSRESS